MNNTSTMLSVRRNTPVDPLTLAILRQIDSISRTLRLPYFVAGAMARDILLTNVFGIDTGRATHDVDFALAVEDWKQFDVIKERLIATKQFRVAPGELQRLYYAINTNTRGYPVDIIPFGGVERRNHILAWPPDMGIVMNVIGYAEVLASATPIVIEDDLIVPIASLPGLALLKLFAWDDRHARDRKDAQDLVILCHRYEAAGNRDRLYGAEFELLESVGYDPTLAGSRLLGKDARAIANQPTLERAKALLDDAEKVDRLLTHMSVELTSAADSITAAHDMLHQFRMGLLQE